MEPAVGVERPDYAIAVGVEEGDVLLEDLDGFELGYMRA
jgi:hypothetical protein